MPLASKCSNIAGTGGGRGEPRHDDDDFIAILGMSCRFPESNNPAEFWNLLSTGTQAVGWPPVGRFGSDVLPEGGYLKCAVDEFDAKFFGISPREAGLIDPQQRLLLEVVWEALENAGMPPRTLKGSHAGIFVGIWQQDYQNLLCRKGGIDADEFHHMYLGNALSGTSGRLSHFFTLLGPNVVIESGCSSSLAAVHLACQSLLAGECPLAIASGVNLTLYPAKQWKVGVDDGNWSVLSPDYRCKTFDVNANGFVRAEGVGAVVLKRLPHAKRDGDQILAIIRGSAMNHDGGGASFGTPNPVAQEQVFREALHAAGVQAADVSYVEAHGTGTAVGDPTEMYSLGRVYSEGRSPRSSQPLYIGSVKTNIGHTESAAGMAGLIKTILCLQHGKIPAHLNLVTLNPKIDLGIIPAKIPLQLTDWVTTTTTTGTPPEGGRRLAAVNSFGMTGTNVHVILQEASQHRQEAQQEPEPSSPPQNCELVTISAKSRRSLECMAKELGAYLIKHPELSLAAVAYTCNVHRAHNFLHRLAITGKSLPSIAAGLQAGEYLTGAGKVAGGGAAAPKIGFLFTGQGSQYVGMGKGLVASSVPFAKSLHKCATLFAAAFGDVDLRDVLWGEGGTSWLQQTLYCQPAIFCLQVCLLQHFAALGLRPDWVLGHSVGEFAAAVAAGGLTLEEAMSLVTERSRLVNSLQEGAMLVLHCGHAEAASLLASFKDSWVDVAAENSPAEVVVSCAKEAVEGLEEHCRRHGGMKCSRLASSHAFHSRVMDSILQEYEVYAQQLLLHGDGGHSQSQAKSPQRHKCKYISGTSARSMDDLEELRSPAYWAAHLRQQVRFADAIQHAQGTQFGAGANILVEIGPQPTLLSLAMTTIENHGGGGGGEGLHEQEKRQRLVACPSLRRGGGGQQQHDYDWTVQTNTLCRLYVEGVDLDWSGWYKEQQQAARGCEPPRPPAPQWKKVDIPTYAFDRARCWFNSNQKQGQGLDLDYGGDGEAGAILHPILGRQLQVPPSDTQIYRGHISPSVRLQQPLGFISDHKVSGRVILPGAVWLEGALAVGKTLLGPVPDSVPIPLTLQNIKFEAALAFDAVDQVVKVQTHVTRFGATGDRLSSGATHTLHFDISFHRLLELESNSAGAAEDGSLHGGSSKWERLAHAEFHPEATSTFLAAATHGGHGIEPWQRKLELDTLKSRLEPCPSVEAAYRSLSGKGMEFGPAFLSTSEAWTSKAEALMKVQVVHHQHGVAGGSEAFVCHPILLDAMFQAVVLGQVMNGTISGLDETLLRFPVAVQKLTWLGRQHGAPHAPLPLPTLSNDNDPTPTYYYVYTASLDKKRVEEGEEVVICLHDESGHLLAVMEGLEMIRLSVDAFNRALALRLDSATATPDFYGQSFIPVLGLTQARVEDLTNALRPVSIETGRLGHTLAALKADQNRSSNLALAKTMTHDLCFYYIVKCVRESGLWAWPRGDVDTTPAPFELVPFPKTRLHLAFASALVEEEYLQLQGNFPMTHAVTTTATTTMATALRPLPSIAECEAQITRLRKQIPNLFDSARAPRLYYDFAVHCGQRLGAVVSGDVTPLSVLFPEENMKQQQVVVGAPAFYQDNATNGMESFIAAFADLTDDLRTQPPGTIVRILEVGGGTGSLTSAVLAYLKQAGLRAEYTFTDISKHFVSGVQDKFGVAGTQEGEGGNSMYYGVLDIERDPTAQGYAPQTYDIVLGFFVLHATSDIQRALEHLRVLLRRGGALLLGEYTKVHHILKVSFAMLDGWWRFNDFRTQSPIPTRKEWRAVLGRAGFDSVTLLQESDDSDMACIISRVAPVRVQPLAASGGVAAAAQTPPSKRHWILMGAMHCGLMVKISNYMQGIGRGVICVTHACEGVPAEAATWKSGECAGAAAGGVFSKSVNFENGKQTREVLCAILGSIEGADGGIEEGAAVEGVVYICSHRGHDDGKLPGVKVGGLLHMLQALISHYGSESSTTKPRYRPCVNIVTRGVHVHSVPHHQSSPVCQLDPYPADATVWSAALTFTNENREYETCLIDIDAATADTNKEENATSRELCAQVFMTSCNQVVRTGAGGGSGRATALDKLFVIRHGRKYAVRLHRWPGPALPPLRLPLHTTRYKFMNPPSGSLSDLALAPETITSSSPMGHYVEVAVRASALNFLDLLLVLKPPAFVEHMEQAAAAARRKSAATTATDGGGSSYQIRGDIAGIVVAKGEGVTRWNVGDAVFGCTAGGYLRSHSMVEEDYLMAKPAWLPFTAAASLPSVFITSHYCLTAVAKLAPGDSVLIHAAAGGVGLSAIQVARDVGATIFVTAGSQRKRAYLRQHLGLNHVYHSRTLDYGRQIMEDTGGLGVDVVLNSLTGPGFKETTLAACAPRARFIEIGKLNIWTAEEVRCLRPDVEFHIVDLISAEEMVEARHHSFEALSAGFQSGRYKPLPCTVFALERLHDAFRTFQETKFIGKVVVKMPVPVTMPSSSVGNALGGRGSPSALLLRHEFFNAESTYLITGGLGGIGFEVAKWMSENGARHIVLAGRRSPSVEQKRVLETRGLSTGCQFIVLQVDVGLYAECARMLQEIKANKRLPPLRGIFLSSGILSSGLVPNQTLDTFKAVFHPKVDSAWALHQLTTMSEPDDYYDLEFFTMFSSIAAIAGMMGQSNHAAASGYMDTLAALRRSSGLPAASINWGPWADVGVAAEVKESLLGAVPFSPAQGIRALEQFILGQHTQVSVADVRDWVLVRKLLNLGPFFDGLAESGAHAAGARGSELGSASRELSRLAAEIKDAAADTHVRQQKVEEYLGRILTRTLRLDTTETIDPDENLSEIGVDSLMAMEMRNLIQEVLVGTKKTLSIGAIQEHKTLRSLSAHIAGLLGEDGEGEDTQRQEAPRESLRALVEKDVTLPPDITSAIHQRVNHNDDAPLPTSGAVSQLILTGATGFLGSHILAQLLTKTKIKVYCIVRASNANEGRSRLSTAFKQQKVFKSEGAGADTSALAELLQDSRRVVLLPGDVTQEGLGLPSDTFQQLASTIDAVIHCAVRSNHWEPYNGHNELRAVNVGGTANVLRFVLAGKPKRLSVASSLVAACRLTEEGLLAEEYPTLSDYSEGFGVGYSMSKFATELLVGAAVRAGLARVQCIRYPSIWGHSRSGLMPTAHNINLGWTGIMAVVTTHKLPETTFGDSNWTTVVPVDVAAAICLELLLNPGTQDGVYNMTTETCITQTILIDVLREFGLEPEILPLSEWRASVFGGGDDEEQATNRQLTPEARWLFEENPDGRLNALTTNPLLQGGNGTSTSGGATGAPPWRANVVSHKMRMALNPAICQGLSLSGSVVLRNQLKYYFTTKTGGRK